MSLGLNIKKFRQKQELFQTDLAKLLNVNQATVSSWETDRTEPNLGTLSKMCDIFQCELSDLLPESEIEAVRVSNVNTRLDLYFKKIMGLTEEQQRQVMDYVDFISFKSSAD